MNPENALRLDRQSSIAAPSRPDKEFIPRIPISTSQRAPHILLLQGPAGPFFSDLGEALQGQGWSVTRVYFNAGDRFFRKTSSKKINEIYFSGSECDWEQWLISYTKVNKIDFIILFGCCRIPHSIAIRIAALHQIIVLSLEEGYLRSGYIACEIGGNNFLSPLVNWHPNFEFTNEIKDNFLKNKKYVSKKFYRYLFSAIYYLTIEFSPRSLSDTLLHRDRSGRFSIIKNWVKHYLFRFYRKLYEQFSYPRFRIQYIFVPLQVPSDSQMTHAARGWTNYSVIDACLSAIAKSKDKRNVIFKIHPLDLDGLKIESYIKKKQCDLKIPSEQIKVIYMGKIGEIVKKARCMIVINSTSAFSAFHNNVPVLALGDSIYRNDYIVSQGNSFSDVEKFINAHQTCDLNNLSAYMSCLIKESLLVGDFYDFIGRKYAIEGIKNKLGSCLAE